MQEDMKSNATVESYKMRSNSHFRNPLLPPKELLVNIPERERPSPNRTPFYRTEKDLIVNGVGEAQRGVPRSKILIGHNSNDLKAQILSHFTKDNLDTL